MSRKRIKQPLFHIGDEVAFPHRGGFKDAVVFDIVNWPPKAGTIWFYKLEYDGGHLYDWTSPYERQLVAKNPLLRLALET